MQTIGRYQLTDKLGQGGMGVVYRAYDTLLERVVAVKVIGAQLDNHRETRERFFREARAAGQLSHPNIITIHDLGEQDGHPFLAMEYLEGEDLQQRLGGPVKIGLARKLELAIETCQGLEYAHAHGVVHRDIKPANIFITRTGQVKILDFGLARLVTSQLTNSNMLMGTLNYMAPEQVRAERADHRADIFSVGVVIYELLGGRKAFEGDSFASTLYKILQEVPEPLWKIDATLPRELTAIVERALAKPPDERYQTMGALRQELELFRDELAATESGVAVRPPSGPPRTGPVAPQPPLSGDPSGFVTTSVEGAPPSGAHSHALRAPRRTLAMIAAGIVVVGAVAIWLGMHRRSSTEPPAAPPTQTRVSGDPEILARAEQALTSQDYAAAERHAQSVLAQAPGDPDAQRILDRARTSAASIEAALQKARTAYAAGDYQAASRAAGDVLTLAPQSSEAKHIMEQGAARSRGRSAMDARRRMTDARESARAAKAPALASSAYRTAVRAEQDAQRLFDSDHLAEATARYYEASGLYQSATLSAQAAAEAPPAAPPAAPSPSTAPAPKPEQAPTVEAPRSVEPPPNPLLPRSPGADAPATPPVTVTAPPPEPPIPPAPVPTAGDAAARVPPEEGIGQLLAQYKSALEGKHLDALKRLWPSLGGAPAEALRAEFQHASSITVDIIEPRISASGGSGTVTFRRRYELRTVDGQRLRSESHTTMDVRRTPAGWIIESVRFSPIR